jgi:oligopeptide/dipeptide ABC transporter ATP-binding protein
MVTVQNDVPVAVPAALPLDRSVGVRSGSHLDRSQESDSTALRVTNLTCTIPGADGTDLRLVSDVSFELERGRTLGIVGESGSGKSMLVRSIMGIGPRTTTVTGSVELNGTDLIGMPRKLRRKRLGREIAMVFQNPMTSLNPVVKVGRQISEGLRAHHGLNRHDARQRTIALLGDVGIPEPERRLSQYPHQLSGGMRQRVTIAAALASDPDVLIADEATTALDVTVQKQILVLLGQIQEQRKMAVIMISHDLGVVSGRTDDLIVMYGGQVVESGPTRDVFRRHSHRYTEALLRAVPSLESEPHGHFATIAGSPPQPTADFVGCRFARRCGQATDECREQTPPWVTSPTPGHGHRCIHPAEISQQPRVDEGLAR